MSKYESLGQVIINPHAILIYYHLTGQINLSQYIDRKEYIAPKKNFGGPFKLIKLGYNMYSSYRTLMINSYRYYFRFDPTLIMFRSIEHITKLTPRVINKDIWTNHSFEFKGSQIVFSSINDWITETIYKRFEE